MPTHEGERTVSKQTDNKTIVGRWFAEFWGRSCNLSVVDDLAAPDTSADEKAEALTAALPSAAIDRC
jgi:hypothetical protein